MDRVHDVRIAAILASLAGGPLLAAMIGTGDLLSGNPVVVDPNVAMAVIGGVPVTMIMGWAFAIIPNLLGASLLGWLGSYNIGTRLPMFWATAGGAAAGLPAWLFSPPSPSPGPTAAMAGVGAVSALLCRAKVRWEDHERVNCLIA